MRLARFVLAACAVGTLVFAHQGAASAAGVKPYEDKQRGYRLKIGEKYELLPPKLTNDESYIVGDWYADAAKFSGGFQRPEFKVMWFATPKAGTITPGANDPPPSTDPPPAGDGGDEHGRGHFMSRRPTSVDEALERHFYGAGPYFGFGRDEKPDAAEIWKKAKVVPTKTPGLDARYVGVNDPDDRKDEKKPAKKKDKAKDKDKKGDPADEEVPEEYKAYALVAKLTLDRPGETIEVGFLGYCGYGFVKDGKKQFLDIVKSFEDLAKIATDSRNAAAQGELNENDPKQFRAAIKRQKLIPGWSAIDTEHYVVVYSDEVHPALVKSIAEQIESLRTQVYEVVFPPDKAITAISVVRVCKDAPQYHAYGGPGGSAGYWYAPGMELVFYEDTGRKEDSLRVLYHEGFHQYIHYSVGEMDPHSWFNEGHGDFFFGHNYAGGKWKRAIASWRRDVAARAKREHKFPSLWEWLHWTQGQYYGMNDFNLPIGDNYALGWDFVYFLRTSRKPEYQAILPKYFDTLKGCVTRSRRSMQPPAPNGEGEGEGDGPAGGGETTDKPPPKSRGLSYNPATDNPLAWLDKALDEAFKGIDVKQLEKDWLETKPE